MKRIRFVLAVAVVMAAMMVATAVPAFAARGSGESANGCGLVDESYIATTLGGRQIGESLSSSAQALKGLGPEVSPDASSCSNNG